VADDRILAVGDYFDVLVHLGPHTRLINLHGLALLPGFVDAHAHWLNDAAREGLTLDQAQDLALASGVTAFGDMFVDPDFLDEMQAYADAGQLRMRASLYLIYATNCGDIVGDWYLEHPPVRDPRAMLRIPGVKIFSDGGSCGLPAVTFAFIGLDPPMGDLFFDQATMNAAVAQADANGYQVVVHAIGDRGRDVAMTAIALALDGHPNSLRHRIEHSSFIRPDQIAFYRTAGIVPTGWAVSTCAVNAGLSTISVSPPEVYGWVYPWRSMLAAGLPLAWHSDWPFRGANVLRHLYGLVTAKAVDTDGSVCEPPAFLAAETITVRQALRMMTLSSAYALGQDSAIGSLERGKLADLIVLSDDPLAVAPDDLKDIVVRATTVGGKNRFCAADSAWLCRD
jgi:predicted amidohydrolase YtcJ